MTLDERLAGEVFTDNSKEKRFEQCKTCANRDDGTVWTCKYDKAYCKVYKYPKERKPQGVFTGKEKCPHYKRIPKKR